MQTRTFSGVYRHRKNPSSGVAYLRISEENHFFARAQALATAIAN
jgi:hypothetical protein